MKRSLSIFSFRLSIFIGLFLSWNPCAKAIVTNQNPFNCGVITLKRSAGLIKTEHTGHKIDDIRIYTLLTQLNLSWNSLPNNGWKVLNNSAGITQVNFTAGQIKKVVVSIPFETLAKHGNTLEPEIVQTIQIAVQKTPMPPTPSDSDGDGLPNSQESDYATNPNNPDHDGDGLFDGEEVLFQGTDPELVDTDFDGILDGTEVVQGSNPLDNGSTQGDGFGGLGGDGSGGDDGSGGSGGSGGGGGPGGGGGGNDDGNNNPAPPPYVVLELGAGRAFLLNDKCDAVISSGDWPNDTYSIWSKGNLTSQAGVDIVDLNNNGDFLAIQYASSDKNWGEFDGNNIQTSIRNINGGASQSLGDVVGAQAPQFIQDEENYSSSTYDQSFDRMGLALNNNGDVFGTMGVTFNVELDVPGDSEPTTQIYSCFLRVFWPQGGGSAQQVDFADYNDYGTYYGGHGWSGENWGYLGQMAGITDDQKLYANAFNQGEMNGSDGLLVWSSPGSSPSLVVNKAAARMNQNGVIIADNDPNFLSHNAVLCNGGSHNFGSANAGSINDNGDTVGFNGSGGIFWQKNSQGDYQTWQLNQLVDPNSGWSFPKAFAINNHKAIAGSGSQGGSQKAVLLLPIEVKQLNYPTDQNTTDSGSHDEKIIGRNGVAYINGTPEMPQLEVSLASNSLSGINVQWKLEIKTERPNERQTKDDKNYPASGYTQLPSDQSWILSQEFGSDFVGGKAKIFCKIDGQAEQTFEFKIRGKNPKDADAKGHIQSTQGQHWYGWPIVQHESRQGNRIYNQFNSGGDGSGYLELPNFGPPDGWGIAQLDEPLDVSATTDEVYSWHKNIEKFYLELQQKKQFANAYFNVLESIYQPQGKWENPPVNFIRQGSSTQMMALEAATIVLYNGASWAVDVKNGAVVYSGPPSQPKQSGAIRYISSWEFHPDNALGSKWEFHENTTNPTYLLDVIYTEFEGHGVTQE